MSNTLPHLNRTPQTIAVNINWILANLKPGATYHSYPNGPGAKPVPALWTRGELDELREDLDDLIAEWRRVDLCGAQAWIDAGPGANPERYLAR